MSNLTETDTTYRLTKNDFIVAASYGLDVLVYTGFLFVLAMILVALIGSTTWLAAGVVALIWLAFAGIKTLTRETFQKARELVNSEF